MIEKKAYLLFLCVLLISVLLFPLCTTAGREILLQTGMYSKLQSHDLWLESDPGPGFYQPIVW